PFDPHEQGVDVLGGRHRTAREISRELGCAEAPELGVPYIFAGSHSASCGSASSTKVNRIMITAYGSAPQITSSIPPLSGRMPCTTNRFIPTGGVIRPSSHISTMKIPYQIGSTPSAVTIGYVIGIVATCIDSTSMNMPRIR